MKSAKLQDLTHNITDGKHGDCQNEEGSGYYFISCKDVKDGRINYDCARQITFQDFTETHKRTQLEEDDFLITNSGTIGRMAFIINNEFLERTTFQKSVAIVKVNKEKIIPKYLYYNIKTNINKLIREANGAAQKNLLLSSLRNFSIKYHDDVTHQRFVVSVLSSYDSLIENNKKQIKLLEEAAQRLYKEWFVDLRFPGHENVKIVDGVPEGWEKQPAENFFTITIGKTPPRTETACFVSDGKGIPWVSIADMGSSDPFITKTSEELTTGAISTYNVKVIPSETILLSFKLTVGRVSIANTNLCTNEAIAHFRIEQPSFREYTYQYLKCFAYDTLGSTSAISKAINSKIVKKIPFIMPNKDILEQFSSITRPMFDEIRNKQVSNSSLAEARDRLLPKLMNGEIEV